MVRVDFSLPKSYVHIDPNKREAFAFRTYMGYWVCLADHLQSRYTDNFAEPLLEALADQPGYEKISDGAKTADRDAISPLLLNGWISELRLNLIDLNDRERLALSNHGAPVDAYYATSHHARAWLYAQRGTGVPQTHASLLKVIAEQIEKSHLYPSPWDLLCTTTTPEETYSGFEYLPRRVNNLAMAANRNDRAAMLLRTTRNRMLKERCEKEKRKGRLPRGTKARLDGGLASTTIFDFAWRMRTRSNYENPAMFLSGTPDHEQATIFAAAVRFWTNSTMFLFEAFMARRAREILQATALDFIRLDSSGLSRSTLLPRLQVLGILE